MPCGGNRCAFFFFGRRRGGIELPFPSADFRLVRPAPAITYILTPILTTDSTPNYHAPSMTIQQAHPQVQRFCALKKTKTDNYHLCCLGNTIINGGSANYIVCVWLHPQKSADESTHTWGILCHWGRCYFSLSFDHFKSKCCKGYKRENLSGKHSFPML